MSTTGLRHTPGPFPGECLACWAQHATGRNDRFLHNEVCRLATAVRDFLSPMCTGEERFKSTERLEIALADYDTFVEKGREAEQRKADGDV